MLRIHQIHIKLQTNIHEKNGLFTHKASIIQSYLIIFFILSHHLVRVIIFFISLDKTNIDFNRTITRVVLWKIMQTKINYLP